MDRIRVLLVDDDEDDCVLARELLKEALHTRYDLTWETDLNWGAPESTTMQDALNGTYDIMLVDYRLGEIRGTHVIRSMVEYGITIPCILFTGENNVAIDREALEAGASDYLVKSQITAPLLDRAIRYAIERKKSEAALVQLAQYDSLTGLLNRSSFQTQLLSSIAHAKRLGEDWGLFLLDLDGFKAVNDTLGHPAGDSLLSMVARRLQKELRDSDIIARIGGDEFCVIGPYLSGISGAAEVARKILTTLSAPYVLNGQTVHIGASVGITMFCADGVNAEQLMKNADLALYDAKKSTRGGYRFFDSDMNNKARIRMSMGKELKIAIDRKQLGLCYQPKVDALTGCIVGAEALARWWHPSQGQISPLEFIPVAESTGSIGQLGDWVLQSACNQINSWCDEGLKPLQIAVNLSTVQLKYSDFLDRVLRTIETSKVDPSLLEFEITESMIVQESDSAIGLLNNLKDIGVSLAIDDFGVGYSSLSHLAQFPVDKLKIDRSFVSAVGLDTKATAIAKTIIDLGKNLDMTIVAEGVETEEQYRFFRSEGCHEIQGYYFCEPLEVVPFTDKYRQNSVIEAMQPTIEDYALIQPVSIGNAPSFAHSLIELS